MQEMGGQYINIIKEKNIRNNLIIYVVFICIGLNSFFNAYGIYDYLFYCKNTSKYTILECVITDIYESGVGRGRMWYTTVYCSSKDEFYTLFSSRYSDEIGKKVIIAVNHDRNAYNTNNWMKPYIPREIVNIGVIPLIIGSLGLYCECVVIIRKVHRKKLIFATVLYKKRYNWKAEVLEYAVCTCYDENGKEFLLETRSGKFPIEVQVKDELAVLVEPGNYKNHEFIMEDGKWIKREELPLGL